MKKYSLIKKLLAIVIPIALLQGCSESDLDVPFAKQTSYSFFAEGGPDSYDKAVIGGYAKLTQFYSNHWGATASHYLQSVALMRDDLITSNTPDPLEVYSSLNATNAQAYDYYKLGYQLIQRMNLTLEYIEEFGDATFVNDPVLGDNYEGEARFLRAYMFFHLALNYGTPPLLTTTLSDLSYLPSNSNPGEVLDFAITELEAAAMLLPTSWSGINTGRATKGSAYGMLGKALLHRGTANNYDSADLTAAIDAFNQVTGYSLLTNFKDNFDGTKENGAESLFEIQFGLAASGSNNIWVAADDFGVIGDIGGYWGFFNYHWTARGRFMLPSTKLVGSFEAGDPRLAMTVSGGTIQKYVAPDVTDGGGTTSFNNARVLRYADVLLMKAEAILMSGGSKAEAIGLLNDVRLRARNGGAIPADRSTTETDETTILTWVMEERVAELAGEEAWRWYDLIRWHKAGKIDLSSWDFGSIQAASFDTGKHLLMPFPSGEVTLSNSQLDQNPNY